MTEREVPSLEIPMQALLDSDQRGSFRAEAQAQAQTSLNWLMAALVTVNGGGLVGLISMPERGALIAVAAAAYVLGIVGALIAGLFSSIRSEKLAVEQSAELDVHRAIRVLEWAVRTERPHNIALGESLVEIAREERTKAKRPNKGFVKPRVALAVATGLFLTGSALAGLAVYSPAPSTAQPELKGKS